MRRTVVLLHTCPGKPDHFDWLIDQPELEIEHRLITFRVAQNPAISASFSAEPAADHRAAYLEFEGKLSGDRGSVSRVAEGFVSRWDTDENEIRCTMDWGQGEQVLVAQHEGDVWLFRAN